MNRGQESKQRLQEFIRVVWDRRDLSALPDFWTTDCVNHAAPEPERVGLVALRAYHEGFFANFLPAFSNARIEFVQQVAEEERVVSQMVFRAVHTGPVFGLPSTGRSVSLASMRIDRFEDGKITEHWSVADLAGLMEQLRA